MLGFNDKLRLTVLTVCISAVCSTLNAFAADFGVSLQSPSALDSRLLNIQIADQGDSPKCTVYAVKNAIEQQMLRCGQSVPTGGFSAEWLWDMARKEDHSTSGVSITAALNIAKNYGLVPAEAYDKNGKDFISTAAKYKIKDYRSVLKSDYAETVSDGAIIVVSTTYQEKNWKDGFLTSDKEFPNGLHATYLAGYDKEDDLFIGANSWGVNWGNRGFYYMNRDFLFTDVIEGYIIVLN